MVQTPIPGGSRRAAAAGAAAASGRVAAGTALATVRAHLQKAVVAFLVGLLGTIYAMRLYVWEFLRDVTERGMSAATAAEFDVVVRTPFDVILLQVKLGTVVGLVFAGLVVLFYARRELRERGLWPSLPWSRRRLAGLVLVSLALFVSGVVYGYELFFPITFGFLAGYTVTAGFAPTYDLVAWTEFVLLLTISFGLAAQMPLVVTALAALEIVPYETFREKWRYAVVAIFVFGAVFSPPDPFTQILWAIPLLVLYGLSLLLAKVVVTVSRAGETVDFRGAFRAAAPRLVALPTLAFVAVWLLGTSDAALAVARGVTVAPVRDAARALLAFAGGTRSAVALVALLVATLVLVAVAIRVVLAALAAAEARFAGVDFAHPDLAAMDAATVRALPLRSFRGIDGQEMLGAVKTAVRAGDRELGEAILDRYDEARAAGSVGRRKRERKPKKRRGRPGEDDDLGTSARRGTAGVLSVLTDDDVDEDDIGGYYEDVVFVLESLTAKSFRLIAVFGGALSLAFFALYAGGVTALKEDFLARMPAEVVPVEAVRIVTLHPVEVLLFVVKVSVLVGAVATVPLVLYYAWPALAERGFVRRGGNREVFRLWGVALLVGFGGGSAFGYLFVAPTTISYLAWDAISAGAVVSYRVSSFFWTVFLTTAFVGLLATIPVTMWLFHHGRIVGYGAMREHWRVVVVAIFLAAALATPDGIVTMLLVGIPVAGAYLVGLGALWVVTLGGRRVPTPTE